MKYRAFIVVCGIVGLLIATLGALDTAKAQTVPQQFQKLIDGYRGWTPKTEDESYANSVYNWATRALEVTEYKKTLLVAARNWAFMRSEGSFQKLASEYKPLVRELYGTQYLARGLQTALSVPYTADIDGAYGQWYECFAKTTGWMDKPVGDSNVLAYLSYQTVKVRGKDEECSEPFGALSALYGVAELTEDDLMVVGFLHRRYFANQANPRFVSAEVIRKALFEAFEDEEQVPSRPSLSSAAPAKKRQ